ncbi:MAG: DUF4920 domain-containing protein [Flavobacteriaceae bacterium CG_4_8_14_3_um_filter_34_10]|nr:MAG: DUF4920 domain-containing protein [Flavobacteriaceae bacterium CG_4_8_14_3_um_filter_34_10]PIZ08642.1 MAG: DUF4920 domain-containing protein [Flavobacteriaceae bacterium CG_4_10_14_0_8_um_filter_34_31]
MKKIIFYASIFTMLWSCKSNNENYLSIGEKITEKEVINKEEMAAIYDAMKPGDTLDVKFSSTVNEVCQSKGCWMKMDLGEKEVMIKFKDYAFFMPKDIAGKEVILNGKAFIEEMSIEDQKHFAEDAGKSEDEIADIKESKRTLSFVSDGVLILQK